MAELYSIRPTTFTRSVNMHAEGSCLVEAGNTRIVVTASVVEDVPDFLAGTGNGWITAEYSMLPRATKDRKIRASTKGRPDGRSLEIQRFIGRALRSAVETGYLGERCIYVDCDVLQADGGTRTAAVNGGMLALVDALLRMQEGGLISGIPLTRLVGAISVGKVAGRIVLDLDYEKDAGAEVDMNVVMADDGTFIEIQGTAEGEPMSKEQLDEMLDAARAGINEVFALQRRALGEDTLKKIGKA